MGTDIGKLFTKDAAGRGAWVDILDPMGEETGIKFKVAGAHSEQFRRAISKAQAEQTNRKARKVSKNVTEEDVQLDFDLLSEVLAKVTLDWNVTKDGEPFELTFDNAKAVYDSAPDVRRQVFEFCSEVRNFFLSESSENE